MKKFLLGVAVGIVFTIGGLYGWQWWVVHHDYPEIALLDLGKDVVEKSLPGARVLDTMVGLDSKAKVNYAYDALYDVDVTYSRAGKVKSMTLNFGRSGGTWIVPNTADLTILDDKAKVLHVLSRLRSRSQYLEKLWISGRANPLRDPGSHAGGDEQAAWWGGFVRDHHLSLALVAHEVP